MPELLPLLRGEIYLLFSAITHLGHIFTPISNYAARPEFRISVSTISPNDECLISRFLISNVPAVPRPFIVPTFRHFRRPSRALLYVPPRRRPVIVSNSDAAFRRFRYSRLFDAERERDMYILY